MIQAMLTTSDNPYDPFDDYDKWYAFDVRLGHHTASYLARIAVTSPDLSETDQALAIEEAVDEIIDENINGLYVKVTREVEEE